jgi:phage tail protein X
MGHEIQRSICYVQFILKEYSRATYVVEYVYKTNRGMSNLQRVLIKIRDKYPD